VTERARSAVCRRASCFVFVKYIVAKFEFVGLPLVELGLAPLQCLLLRISSGDF
jgi:hypothetical protein